MDAEEATDEAAPSDRIGDDDAGPSGRQVTRAYKHHKESLNQPTRVPVEAWLAEGGDRQLILGGAGLGKSTVLRCLALDFLSEPRVFPRVVSQLKDRIPVFVSFAFWTRLVAKAEAEVSVLDVVRATYGASLPGAGPGRATH